LGRRSFWSRSRPGTPWPPPWREPREPRRRWPPSGSGYAKLKGEEGIGLGDVKLAAAIGAWLPLEHVPICFALATGAALLYALQAHLRGREVERTTPLPFGAFLCPALWLVFYAGVVLV
jgi:prepilin signal peptidase PulO-like enzyme (type II secretory pathway)